MHDISAVNDARKTHASEFSADVNEAIAVIGCLIELARILLILSSLSLLPALLGTVVEVTAERRQNFGYHQNPT